MNARIAGALGEESRADEIERIKDGLEENIELREDMYMQIERALAML